MLVTSPGAIKDVYALISHISFLERRAADLKNTIASMQEEKIDE